MKEIGSSSKKEKLETKNGRMKNKNIVNIIIILLDKLYACELLTFNPCAAVKLESISVSKT